MFKTEPFRRIAGGKWFLSPFTLALLIPYLLTTSILAAVAQLASLGFKIENYWAFFAELSIANFLAFVVCWALVLLANSTILRSKSQTGTGLLTITSVSFGLGATKGLVTGLASLPMGIFPDFSTAVGYKWLHTGILGVLLIPLLALVAYSLEQMEAKHRLLVSERVQGLMSNQSTFTEPNQLVGELKGLASRRIDELERKLIQSPEKSAELIRETILDLVDKHIKPLSRKIYREDSTSRNPFSLTWTVETVFRYGIVGHPIAFVIIGLTLFMGYLQVVEPIEALLESGSVVLAISVITLPIIFLRPRTMAKGLAIFLLWTGLSVPLGLSLSDLIVPRQNPSDLVALGFIIWLLVIQNIVFVAVAQSTFSENRTLDAKLQGIFRGTNLDAQAQRIFQEVASRNLAQYLHSNVQNKLLSASLALDASKSSNPKMAIDQLRAVIDSIDSNHSREDRLTWFSLIESVRAQWDGFLDLQFQLEPGLESWLEKPNSLIYETVSECVSNSLRHGKANQVLIRFESGKASLGSLQIVVEDNGFGPRNGKPGLGTKLIASASRGLWKLEAMPGGGSRLACEIPLSSHTRPRQESNLRPRD